MVVVAWVSMFAFPKTAASQSVSEFELKAVFIYNFTQFIQWPESSFEKSEGNFVIGVLGENVFGGLLEEAVAGEKYRSRPIIVKYFKTARDISPCHILYVGTAMDEAKVSPGQPVLTIGEGEEFMENGGLLRFYTERNKIKFEINSAAAGRAGLVISSKLLGLATIYKEK